MHRLDAAIDEASLPSDAGGRDGSAPTDAGHEPTAPLDAAALDDGSITDDAAQGIDAGAEELGTMVIEVTTKPSALMPYGSLNLLAMWIEDDQEKPVKVLGVWAVARAAALRELNERIGSASLSMPRPYVDPDTITSATLRRHELHSVTWDLHDFMDQVIVPGPYTLWIEATDNLVESYVVTIPVTLGDQRLSVALEESTSFGPITVTYTPASP